MDNRSAWNLCAVGNIVKTRIDENGELRHGTKEFVGGAKVYLAGRFWNKEAKIIKVVGLTRIKKYLVLDVPVNCIENVRLQAVFKPRVVEIMNNFEFYMDWWHTTADDKRDIKRFIAEWNATISMEKSEDYADGRCKSNYKYDR